MNAEATALTPSIPAWVFAALFVAKITLLGYTLLQARGTAQGWALLGLAAVTTTSAVLMAVATQHWPERSFRLCTTHGLFLVSAVAWLGIATLVATATPQHPGFGMISRALWQRHRIAGIALGAATIVVVGALNEIHGWSEYHRISLMAIAPAAAIAILAIRTFHRKAARATEN